MKNGLVKKFLQFSYGSWVTLIIGIGTAMVTTRILDPDTFGKASMYTLAINFSMLAVMVGFDSAFVRFFYDEDEASRPKLLFKCIAPPMILFAFAAILLIIFSKPLNMYLFGENKIVITYLIIISLFISVIYRFALLVVRMQQNGKLYSNILIYRKVTYFIFTVLVFWIIGDQYQVIIVSTILSSLLVLIFAVFRSKNFWVAALKSQGITKAKTMEMFKYSYPLVFSAAISILFQGFDKIALREWSTYTELGLYTGAFRLVTVVTVVKTTFSTFWTPVSYEHFSTNPQDRSFYKQVSNYVAVGVFFIAVCCILFKDIIIMLLGSSYHSAASIMPFLIFMPILYTLSETTVIGINFYKKSHWHILVAAISCIVNIVLNYFLVRVQGAVGAAMATAISYVVFFTLRTVISLKYYKVNYGLTKIYTVILLLLVYAFLSSFILSFTMNILVGLSMVTILVVLYYSVLMDLYQNRLKPFLLKIKAGKK